MVAGQPGLCGSLMLAVVVVVFAVQLLAFHDIRHDDAYITYRYGQKDGRIVDNLAGKSQDAENGWVDLTPENMQRWQGRLRELQESITTILQGAASSQFDRAYPSTMTWQDDDSFDIGEIVGWLFIVEEKGRRGKT